MGITIASNNPNPFLMAEVRAFAWGAESDVVVVDYVTAEIDGLKSNWQVAFNEQTGDAAVIDRDRGGPVHWLKADSVAQAALEASRRR